MGVGLFLNCLTDTVENTLSNSNQRLRGNLRHRKKRPGSKPGAGETCRILEEGTLEMEASQVDMSETLITLTSDIVAAHVSNNNVGVEEVSTLIANVYGALAGLGQPVVAAGRVFLVSHDAHVYAFGLGRKAAGR